MRLVAFDAETTGTSPEKDRIVELSLCVVGEPVRTFRVNPGVPIPEGATRVHGIRDEDVAQAPTFAAIAPEVEATIEGAVLVGYNSRSFDTLLLDAELRRAGRPGLPLEQVREVDVMRVWHALEPRSLSGATRRWLGRDHERAHSSAADVQATLAVLEAMMRAHGLDHDACIRHSTPAHEIDRAGKLALDADGRIVLTFGKYAGVAIEGVDPAYIEWMLRGQFPETTKAALLRIIADRFPAMKAP